MIFHVVDPNKTDRIYVVDAESYEEAQAKVKTSLPANIAWVVYCAEEGK